MRPFPQSCLIGGHDIKCSVPVNCSFVWIRSAITAICQTNCFRIASEMPRNTFWLPFSTNPNITHGHLLFAACSVRLCISLCLWQAHANSRNPNQKFNQNVKFKREHKEKKAAWTTHNQGLIHPCCRCHRPPVWFRACANGGRAVQNEWIFLVQINSPTKQ